MAPSVARSIKDTMMDASPSPKARINTRRQEAAAVIRGELFEKVRTDWSFNLEDPTTDITPDLYRRVEKDPTYSGAGLAWVERGYSSSSETEVPVQKNALGIFEAAKPVDSGNDPYHFDRPESVGAYINDIRSSKRRRIRKDIDDELAWNKSLQHWTKQRAAWTGERTRKVPRGGSSSSVSQEEGPSKMEGIQPSGTSLSTSSISSGTSAHHTASPSAGDAFDLVDEVPKPPPIIPSTAPIRSSVTTATYPQVYDKVCEAGLTPTIPINLKDVTLAMVQGWKKRGDWAPAKLALPEPVFARRRKQAAEMKIDLAEPESPKHPHLSKGVGVMKKALGINGSSSSGPKEVA
jgi:hypothetical protein